MPENDIIITGAATSNRVDGAGTEASRYVAFQSASQTLKFIEDYTQNQIQFVLTGKKVTGENEPSSPSAILSWSLSGTNADSYSIPANVTVTIIDAPTGTPELTVATPDTNNQIGKMSLYAMCSHPGTLYYIVSQDKEKTQIQYTEIKAASEEISIQQTDIGTVYTNPSRTIYGFKSAPTAQAQNELAFEENLQSEAKYYVRVYCVNLISVVSTPQDVTWIQASNGGKPLIARFDFGKNITNSSNITTFTLSELKESQRKKVACLICQYTQNEKDRVFGKGGVSCETLNETVKESTSANATNTTKLFRFLIDADTNRSLLNIQEKEEYFVVMPNLFRTSADLSGTQTILESQTFINALESSKILEDLTVSSVSCSLITSYPITPTMESPAVVPSEQQIAFTWIGANNTNGFIFVGVAPYSNTTTTPSVTQLKKNSGFDLTGQSQGFYTQNEQVTLTVTPLSMCLDYKYYWVATNEDPDTYQYQTKVYEGKTATIGCANFGILLKIASWSYLIWLIWNIM